MTDTPTDIIDIDPLKTVALTLELARDMFKNIAVTADYEIDRQAAAAHALVIGMILDRQVPEEAGDRRLTTEIARTIFNLRAL